jgi:transmembrane sensor
VNATASERDAAIVQAMEWLLRLDASPSDSHLKRDFQQWLEQADAHREAFRSVQMTWAALGKLPEFPPVGEAVPENVVPLPVRRSHCTRWVAASLALVAACVALVAFPIIQTHLLADYITGVAELRDVTLPDGSVAHLDAGSAIAVDYRETSRQISLLAGQAFFEVVRDQGRPFKVLADDVSVLVTGTAFSVRKGTEAVAIAVQSGTVRVFTDNDAGNSLTMGQRLVYNRQSRAVSRGEIPPAQVASWRSRQLVVYDATFGDIVEELGRHLAGAILVRDRSLNQQTVTGVFDVSHPDEALNTLADSQGASVIHITPYLAIISRR